MMDTLTKELYEEVTNLLHDTWEHPHTSKGTIICAALSWKFMIIRSY